MRCTFENASAFCEAAQFGYLLWGLIPIVALTWVCSKLQQASDCFREIASRSLMESRCARYTPCRNIRPARNELLKNRFIVPAACHHHDREARVVNSVCRCASHKQQRYNLLRFAPRLCHVNRPVQGRPPVVVSNVDWNAQRQLCANVIWVVAVCCVVQFRHPALPGGRHNVFRF